MTGADYALPAVALASGSMPLLGLGTWPMRDDDVAAAIEVALETGYRHLDTATAYGNEAGIGRALAVAGSVADDVFVTTKLPPELAGQERSTLEASLEKLGRDHVSLWLIHWPPDGQAAPAVWDELVRARDDGLTRAIGVSNYSLEQIDELTRATGVTPEVNQIKWGPLLYDSALVAEHADRGVVLEGYSPLKASNLSAPTLREVAAVHDITPAQVVIAWHAAHGCVVIPKSAQPERIVQNAQAVRVPLSAAEVAAIDALSPLT
ncbi:aldo/keto reductase [uncultured Friedmanniella sp.]|uniref:aldo/keto reductase n=1 Tax=uncultured Friedmanniella sp. TaxID=335381 RepID=UPI0035CBFE09